jgi:hypothetical protein
MESPLLLISARLLHLQWRCRCLYGAARCSPACLHDTCFSDPAAALSDSRRATMLVYLKLALTLYYFDIDLSVFLKDYTGII